MAGSLVVLARQSPLNGGTTIPGAQLFVYDAATTTKRAIYTTPALSIQHLNPLAADANGRFPAVYVNPDSGAYKTVLAPQGDTDPPASPFWTEDNIPVLGSGYSEGTFPATLTGYAAGPTGTVNYRIFANAGGTGKLCTLYLDSAITGTSNATSMTMTGVPAVARPSVARMCHCWAVDENLNVPAGAIVGTSGTITFYGLLDDQGAGSDKTQFSSAGFLGSNTKGLSANWSITYPL